jgi:hypothetical protein
LRRLRGPVRPNALDGLLPPGPAGEPRGRHRPGRRPGRPAPSTGSPAARHPVYALLTGHPEREPDELVFLADLTVELRAWPHDTWAKLGIDPDQVAQAVIGCWPDGEVTGLQVEDLGFEEARSLTRPAMTHVRGQLRGRLTARVVHVHRRWLHRTSGRHPGDRFP